MSAIEVHELHKSFGSTTAVNGASFQVEQGEIFGILGPNGAGKTTTVEVIEGITKPDSGTVSVLGLDPFADRDKLRQRLGAQLQESRLPARLRVEEALRLYGSFYPDPVPVGDLLDRMDLRDKRRTAFDDLSGGQQQRLSIALALIGRPEVAILDEVTTGLDPSARRNMWDTILQLRDTGVTVVLVTHFMEEAERLCDRLALLRAGEVVAVDTPQALVDRSVGSSTVSLTASEVDEAALRALPGVNGVSVDGHRVTITGTGDLVTEVTGALHASQASFSEVQVERATLDDAFLHLTGDPSISHEEAPR